ncbi:MAG: ATP-dependent DNA helicase [Vicinamibacterales bacterium]
MPEVPAVSGTPGLAAAVEAAFADDGPLASRIPQFEPRPGQREMASRVAAAFQHGGTVLAEAGTGTGKTMAYLVPAILSRQRVIVSTGTKNLQEQIFYKDLPALREALGIPFNSTYMKGRANYLCLHRFEQARAGGARVAPEVVESLAEWARLTETGDRAEIDDLPEDSGIWHEISATAETCLGSDCPQHHECFVTRMRQRAAESDIVIVNHHLLCADASVRRSAYGEVIPACRHLVLDEAHQLEDVATQYFGISVSNHRVEDLERDADRLLNSGFLEDRDSGLRKAVGRVHDHARGFFDGLQLARRSRGTGGDDRLRIGPDWFGDVMDEGLMLLRALDAFEGAMTLAGGGAKGSGTETGRAANEDALTIAQRAGALRDELRFLLAASDPKHVYFLEVRGRGIFLRAAPIDVSDVVREYLLDRRATVLTSATLADGGTIDYVKGRLGIDEADEVRVPSEFDYRRQSVLYLPRRMPQPRDPGFADAVADEVMTLLRISQGRAFVLFTSYAGLRAVETIVAGRIPYPLLVQGSAPRHALLDQFRNTPNAVLFATSSFWQGVDVVGEQLSAVIIDKLPFQSPGDPITAARIETITESGGDAFHGYQVPLAILALLQGLGRLLRHRTDHGILAILDPRLRTMGYGRRFLASLPPSPVTGKIEDVEKFFRIRSQQAEEARRAADAAAVETGERATDGSDATD